MHVRIVVKFKTDIPSKLSYFSNRVLSSGCPLGQSSPWRRTHIRTFNLAGGFLRRIAVLRVLLPSLLTVKWIGCCAWIVYSAVRWVLRAYLLHLDSIVAFSHRLLGLLLWRDFTVLLILVAGTALLVRRFLNSCDAAPLGSTTQTLLLLLVCLSVLPELFLMLVKHTGWETLENPFVAEALIWSQAL